MALLTDNKVDLGAPYPNPNPNSGPILTQHLALLITNAVNSDLSPVLKPISSQPQLSLISALS